MQLYLSCCICILYYYIYLLSNHSFRFDVVLSRLQCIFFLFYSDAFISSLSIFPHPFFSSYLPSCDISQDYYLSYYLLVLDLHLLNFELFNFFVLKSMLCKNYYFYFIYSTVYLFVCLLIYYLTSLNIY